MTPGRKAILNILQEDSVPRCLADFVRELHGQKGCDASTVFRNLEKLTEIGILEEISISGEKRNFYAIRPGFEISHHHHHIVCGNCKTVIHMDFCMPVALFRKVEKETGFQVTGHQLEFSGICQNCQ